MKKYCLLFPFLILLSGCSKSEDDIRTIVQQELSKNVTPQFITSAQVVGSYTPAIKVGKFLFISGQIGVSQQTTELVSNDLESQTRQVLENIDTLLKQAGYDSSNIIQCTVFLKDINDFTKMNLVYGGYFTEGKYPTRNVIEVSHLPKNARVEIAAIAYK